MSEQQEARPGGDEVDGKMDLPAFDKFNTVQELLNQNKLLINEITSNQEQRTPEGLARNVLLIRELNANVAKVVQMYKEISDEFVAVSAAPQPST